MTELLSKILLVMLLAAMITMALSEEEEERVCKKSYDCDGWSSWKHSCCVGGKCELKRLFANMFCENDTIEDLTDYTKLCECMAYPANAGGKDIRVCGYGFDRKIMIKRCHDFVAKTVEASKL